jgi:hypothetical protein
MELIVIWFWFGVISAIIAYNKGRNIYAWFATGVLLGPIGLILAAVVSKNRKL